MKNRYFFLLYLCFIIASFTYGQSPQLTFRFANPRIIRISGIDNFAYDIQVMASAGGTYLWSGQARMTFDNSTLDQDVTDDWLDVRGPLLSGTDSHSDNKYNITITTVTSTPKKAYIAWTADPASSGKNPGPADFNAITTSYQTLLTVEAPITSSTGVAGISYDTASMNNEQFYISAPHTFVHYIDPNLYNPHNFVRTYVGRIYSNTWGWSQVGNTVDAQWVDWTTAVNTSVWDTIGGTAAQIASSVTNGLAGALRIDTTAALNINAGAALTCSGATEINGPRGLVISAGSSGMGQFLDNGTITYNNGATAQAQCYLAYNQWHYYAIPVTTTQAYPYYYKYMRYVPEPTSHYKYVMAPDTTLSTSMLGYEMYAENSGPYATDNYVKPSGILNTGSKSINITNTSGSTNEGWNLIGNPYPSAIDLTSGGISWGTAYPTAYFWNPTEGNYDPYPSTSPYPTTHSPYAPPQQAFFVYCSLNTSFGVNNSARLINSTPFLKDVLPDQLILTATSSNNSYSDESIIRFVNGASTYFDPYYDAFKLYGNSDAPQLYSIGNADTIISVNSLPWIGNSQVVPMGFSCGVNGNYSILASNLQSFQSNINIYLEDLKTNTTQDLDVNPLYDFSYTTSDNANRFLIHFNSPASVINNGQLSNMQIYSFENYVYVKNLVKGTTKGTIQIYDLLGRKVFQGTLKDAELNKFTLDVNEGYYMVNVITDDNSYNQKVYLE
jgi:hypothetical protein